MRPLLDRYLFTARVHLGWICAKRRYTEATNAVIPGASITATNAETEVLLQLLPPIGTYGSFGNSQPDPGIARRWRPQP
jgi:hypothetical protein